MALEQYIVGDWYHPKQKEMILTERRDKALAIIKERYPDIEWEDNEECFPEFEEQYEMDTFDDDDVAEYKDALDLIQYEDASQYTLTESIKFNDLQQYILAREWYTEFLVDNPNATIEDASKGWAELDLESQDDFVSDWNNEPIYLTEETLKELYETCKADSWDDLLAKYDMSFPTFFWGNLGDEEKRVDFNMEFIEAYEGWNEVKDEFPYLVYIGNW